MTQPRLLGGRYELDGVIGRGGMAEVYRARDLRLDRTVAIKTLRSDLARDATFQARFRREAQSAASLNHPSVIAVYDTGEDTMGNAPVPYIVMEYVEGMTLRDLLHADRRLLPERALEIVDGILQALDYSHRGGIIHRDIKPANVMLTPTGEVKVMDFGIARAMADSAATMTQTAQVIGTAQYLSPEQARGERVDARSDLYSTGCVLYELLTGRPPFSGDSPVAIAYQHVREDPIPPSRVDPEIPRWADAIVLKAMAKDAAMRYQSAAEMRSDIQRALQGMPVAAPTMAMGRTQVMGAGPAATQVQRAPTGYDLPPVRYDDEPRGGGDGKKVALWVLLALLFIGGAAAIGFALSGQGGGGGPEQVKVPNVVGQTQEQATKAITDQGLVLGDVREEFSDSVKKGVVISSEPGANEEVDQGSTVDLVVSKGKETVKVEVPDVVGQPYRAAQSELEQAGFKVNRRTAPDNEVPRGSVIRTTPEAGEKADQGSVVVMYVSTGRETVEVPNVVNLSEKDAKETLRQAGLKVSVQRGSPEGDVPEGSVFRQFPPAGQEVARGTTVTIFVAENQGPTGEPSLPFPGGGGGGGGGNG
ncbi:MAG TPA: Stk1 family PASTA domain-containing Ser/Thr kinase [Streptosporangiaceae bacterium]|nr:Stk1 family PASTA domain-containing Ser/Thr kinase [Streptosporangiaceae bacterium]